MSMLPSIREHAHKLTSLVPAGLRYGALYRRARAFARARDPRVSGPSRVQRFERRPDPRAPDRLPAVLEQGVLRRRRKGEEGVAQLIGVRAPSLLRGYYVESLPW